MDVALEVTDQGCDLVLEGGDLKADEGLRTAATVALFCDARADEADVATPEQRRGWWGEQRGDQWGSLLWLLDRTVQSQENLERARLFAQDALRWMQRERVAGSLTVTASYVDERLELVVQIDRGGARRWSHLWTGEESQVVLGNTGLHILPG